MKRNPLHAMSGEPSEATSGFQKEENFLLKALHSFPADFLFPALNTIPLSYDQRKAR
jgi:hypothetical protein